MAQVSEIAALAVPATSEDLRAELIVPPEAIFAYDRIAKRLNERIADTRDPSAIRSATVSVLREEIDAGRGAIAVALSDRPRAAREAMQAYSYLTDCVIRLIFDIASTRLHPNPTPTDGERLAVIAVGGYGRGEMAPYSDVDLLFLMPWKVTPWAESLIESMLYILWDLHLKIGHASRTIKDCIRLGRDDIVIRTSLLEMRHILGDEALSNELTRRFRTELLKGTASEFIEAKLEERDARHHKEGGQRYMVEPNVKEGKGGLRDLQTLYWIGKYLHKVDTAKELIKHKLLTADEYDRFRRAESFLMAVRCHLHLAAGRAMDQLTFDMQVVVAERMQYVDKSGRRAVEHFMQDYFRHATGVGDVTRIFLTALEARHVKTAPTFASFFRRKRKLSDGFVLVHNRIAVKSETAFLKEKLNLLRVFDEALRTGYLIHPDLMRLVSAHLDMIDDDMRMSAEANKLFLGLMLRRGSPERALRRMNELGVLSAFMPEFAPIVAMMQFNMYHHYTVDEHTIQCISALSQIERGELPEELPIATKILSDGVNRKVLYVALLLHDIGKGRDEDHSILGAQIARKVAPRLGLNRSEAETVEWLVRHHLLMSDMAQKRDLSEPRTIRDFAKAVQTRKRLDLLTVLTVCDIRGVGPNTWNNWKAVLIRSLYRLTAQALEHGAEAINRVNVETEAKKALADALSDWDAKDVRQERARHYGPYWQGLGTDTHEVFARLLKGIEDHEIRLDVKPDEDRDATRVCFALADHPGIFSRLAGALALVGANVVDARTYTTSDGYATAVFWVQDAEGSPYDQTRIPRLRATIEKTLRGEVLPRKSLADRDQIKKREREFRVPTSIIFDNEGSDIYTIIEVDTRDRPGLLYDLTRTLSEANVYIASAVIATYGEQVVDSFYVKDMFGLKFHSVPKQKTLEKRLRAAISEGAERAKK